jgi:predicted ThiF/HesA family dinucleotide-utilizing enzyme
VKKIVIVGVGALGSHVGLFLRNEAELKVVDFDRVEQKNVLSQFHAKATVGKNKAEAFKDTMKFLFGAKVETAPFKLVEGNAAAILSGRDLVIDCLDNGEGRRVIQRFVRAERIPCLHGALAADGAFGRSVWDEDFAVDDEPGAGAATCEGGEHLPFITAVSGFIAKSAQEFLTKGRRPGYNVYPGGAKQI